METNIRFNVARLVTCTEVEGPFKRAAVWFQGCNIGCLGCCNSDITSFRIANVITLEELMQVIVKAKQEFGIEGVTFSGGEPTLQLGLEELCRQLHFHRLGIILFTGRLIHELPDSLVKTIDLIIDGPFQLHNLETERRLIGSKNQRLIDISGRYKNDLNWYTTKKEIIEEINVADHIYIHGDATVDNEKQIRDMRTKRK